MKFKNLLLIIIIATLTFSCAKPNDPAKENNVLKIFNILETGGYAYDFDVSDELLFAAEDQRGFSIHNLVSGSMYCHVDTLFDDFPNPFENVRKIAGSVDDDILIVYERYGNPAALNIYDISDPFIPEWKTQNISQTSDVQKILLTENQNNDLEIFWTNDNSLNIATYNNTWTNEATIDLPNTTGGSSVQGFDFNQDLFVVAGSQFGVHIIDRNTDELILTYDTIGEAVDVKLVDNLAYIALWEEGYLLLDITDPADPIEIHQENVGENIYTVDVKNNKMVLSSHTGGVLLFDVLDDTEPVLLGNLRESDIGYTYKANFEGDHIIASTRTGIIIIEY
ncbi:MAG: hypothetical protein K9N09_10700 [Candidatus Cloacimonetes bacterium]|nr:hypothetical protein [Candidatus Cloacimonadota bacterium]MCF7813664.1 hypothetical protein [Candidatus Cloacimonadota bacterium]MCF7869154.1 hypothetical protein [Candidatus Cloacimonadota bacterium]MCF7882500.1 hypothetical protein [Candidatus Cloacimonadota bacterium]